ncbi:MAG: ABC transporter permease subunit [Anaerolineae bacterium]
MAHTQPIRTSVEQSAATRRVSRGVLQRTRIVFRKYGFYYLLALPGLLYFLVFHYLPMMGIVIAFKDISPYDAVHDILYGEWVGFTNFTRFFNSIYFWNVLSNTLIISGLKLLFAFPASLVLALLINEVRHTPFKRVVQTISYMPHFLSIVVVAGLITNLFSTSQGPINGLIREMGQQPISFLTHPEYFRQILVAGHVWQTVGWGTILYLAAMANVPQELYEAAAIDGANRFQQIIYITLPSIAFVIVILFLFAVGNLLNAGFEQILLLYSPAVYSVADIIDTYVYRQGLLSLDYSYAAAVNLFKSGIAMVLLLGANQLARKLGQPGLW